MGGMFKSIAKIAAPIVGNMIAPGIGSVIGGAIGGAVGGGGIKGALAGAAGAGFGNFASGALSNLSGGMSLGNALKNASFFGQSGNSPLSSIFGGGNGQETINWNTPRMEGGVSTGVGPITKLANGETINWATPRMEGAASPNSFSGVLDRMFGASNDSSGFDKLIKIGDVLSRNFAEPEGLVSYADMQKQREAREADQVRQNVLFMQALNAPAVNRGPLSPLMDYSNYGTNGGEQLFFTNPNPTVATR